MKIQLNLTNKEVEHIRNHSFSDNCNIVWNILLKIQKRVNSVVHVCFRCKKECFGYLCRECNTKKHYRNSNRQSNYRHRGVIK